MATMMLGVLGTVIHIGMIKMFRLPHLYSPGLATAIVLLLLISIYAFAYVIRHDLMEPVSWLFGVPLHTFGLVVAQQIVIRTSGVKYSEFLKTFAWRLSSAGKLPLVEVAFWAIAAMTLDRLGTTALEGTAEQCGVLDGS
jgi:hypothetical protein